MCVIIYGVIVRGRLSGILLPTQPLCGTGCVAIFLEHVVLQFWERTSVPGNQNLNFWIPEISHGYKYSRELTE